MLHLLFLLYRWSLHNPYLEAFNCIVWGLLDMLVHVLYVITGADRPPAYFPEWQAKNHTFIPPIAYPLPERKNTPRFSWLDARGFYSGACVFRYLPLDEVQGMLTPGLKLDPKLINPDKQYPIVYLFGYQQDLHQSWMLFGGINYLEFCVGVLGVSLENPGQDYAGPFMYLPRLFLNRIYPTILGILCCYAKKWMRIETTALSYTVRPQFGGQPVVSATFQEAGPVGKPASFPVFDPWRELLDAPSANHFAGRDYVFLDYDWGWKFADMQPLSGTVTIHRPGIPGMPPGTHDFAGLQGDLIGAFRVVLPFEWVPPFRRAGLHSIPKLLARTEAQVRGGAASQ